MSMSPAILTHCRSVYAKMSEEAEKDSQGNLYWEGAGTRLVEELGLSNPYYTNVMNALKAMDCVRLGRRGGGGTGSIWFILQEPTDELYASVEDKLKQGKERKNSESDQKMKAMNDRLGRLEQLVGILQAKVDTLVP